MAGKSTRSEEAGVVPAELRVYVCDDGSWAWCYAEPAADLELHSNETYPSRDEAAAAAARAYPDVSVTGEPRLPGVTRRGSGL